MGSDLTGAVDSEISAVEWGGYLEAYGTAENVGTALSQLLASSDFESASAAWEGLEEHVFSQGTLFSVAEPTVSVLMTALLQPQPSWREGRIVDLLFYILKADSRDDPDLARRCLERAREGLWLLIGRSLRSDGWRRDNLLEVIELLDPARAEFVRGVGVAGSEVEH